MKLAAALALALCLALPAAGAPSPDRQHRDVSAAGPPVLPQVRPPSSAEERFEVQVLLSSIDMTVSLIDAYGRCREEERSHDACMAMIRTTLEHARGMIGE